jgi:hypothetical protein
MNDVPGHAAHVAVGRRPVAMVPDDDAIRQLHRMKRHIAVASSSLVTRASEMIANR